MENNRQVASTQPPPLVPQSLRGWVAPLARAALAALVISGCLAIQVLFRQGQELTDSLVR